MVYVIARALSLSPPAAIVPEAERVGGQVCSLPEAIFPNSTGIASPPKYKCLNKLDNQAVARNDVVEY
jgi:hypothetical protein